jgi:hypothetical protein
VHSWPVALGHLCDLALSQTDADHYKSLRGIGVSIFVREVHCHLEVHEGNGVLVLSSMMVGYHCLLFTLAPEGRPFSMRYFVIITADSL